MNFSSMQLYAQMQEEIGQLEALSKNEITRLEGCFSITLSYLDKIKKRSASYVFSDEKDEIHFFKNIKPLFMAAIEYYTLLYQAVLFKPADNDQLAVYWLQQLKRVDRFNNRHREFYQYYISGRTHRDKFYFTRAGIAKNIRDRSPVDKKPSDPAYYLAARILAQQQYRMYVEMELEMLARGVLNNNLSFPETDLPYLSFATDTAVFSLGNTMIPFSGFKQYFVSLISILFSYR